MFLERGGEGWGEWRDGDRNGRVGLKDAWVREGLLGVSISGFRYGAQLK